MRGLMQHIGGHMLHRGGLMRGGSRGGVVEELGKTCTINYIHIHTCYVCRSIDGCRLMPYYLLDLIWFGIFWV